MDGGLGPAPAADTAGLGEERMADRGTSTHESFDRATVHRGASDRAFGLTFAVVLAILAAVSVWRAGSSWPYTLTAAGIIAGIALVRPALLAPLNRGWMKFGLLVNRITTPVILGLLFILMITPIGLIMRMAGKDPLRLKGDPDAESYWVERAPPGPSPETMTNQF